MAYKPKVWYDLPDETTPIQAKDLNHIENGIEEVDKNNTKNTNAIGTMANLQTTSKTDLVSAINENTNAIGTIIAVTTNDNGTAVKFSNGTMICLGKISTQMGASSTWTQLGSVYGKTISGTWNFPVAFKTIYSVVASVDGADTGVWLAGVSNTLTAITGVKVRYNEAPNYYGGKFNYIAVGTWK